MLAFPNHVHFSLTFIKLLFFGSFESSFFFFLFILFQLFFGLYNKLFLFSINISVLYSSRKFLSFIVMPNEFLELVLSYWLSKSFWKSLRKVVNLSFIALYSVCKKFELLFSKVLESLFCGNPLSTFHL